MATKAFDKRAAYENKKTDLQKEVSVLLQSQTNNLDLNKTTSNLFRNPTRYQEKTAKSAKINVKHFDKVIDVDAENLIAEIEGMATYETIVQETLKYHCLPTVVPELKSITIGGALAGIGIESSSFRYGLVHETILEYEILTGDGQVVVCRPDNEHKDLYYAFPNSYGTIGYELKVKVKLIPTKPNVKHTHQQFDNSTLYFETLNKLCLQNREQSIKSDKEGKNYIDGVVFDKNNMIITTAEFVDKAPFLSNYKYLNIYYLSLLKKKTDYLSPLDYIWRWDPDWFWCSKHFFMQNKLLRLLFGKWMLKSTTYWKIRLFFNKNKFAGNLLEKALGRTESVIQDIEVPIQNAESFLDFFQTEIGIKPIWICPIMPLQKDSLYSFYKMTPNTLYINFGFWDMIPSDKPAGYYNKKIEAKVQELGGNKSLYSKTFYTQEQFWSIYDKELYDSLKKKYDPNNILKDLYQKCIN